MTTGERIRIARKNAGLTQSELAEKIGVKYSAIHKYETGLIVNLKRDTIDALSKALNVKPSWLMCIDERQATVEDKLSGLSDDEINKLFMQLIAGKDKDYLLSLASQILELASKTQS